VVAVMFLACAVTVQCEENIGKNDPLLFGVMESVHEMQAERDRLLKEKGIRNLGKDCWKECRRNTHSGNCYQHCGPDAYCCRRGYKSSYGDTNSACEKAGGGCKNYHCCIEKVPTARNVGKQCWYKCGHKGGECPKFCGNGALCCRQGYKNAGCTGGCKDKHCCTKK